MYNQYKENIDIYNSMKWNHSRKSGTWTIFCTIICTLMFIVPSINALSPNGWFVCNGTSQTTLRGYEITGVNYDNEDQSTNSAVTNHIDVPYVYVETATNTWTKYTIGSSGDFSTVDSSYEDNDNGYVVYKRGATSEKIELGWVLNTGNNTIKYYIKFMLTSTYQYKRVIGAIFVDLKVHSSTYQNYYKYNSQEAQYDHAEYSVQQTLDGTKADGSTVKFDYNTNANTYFEMSTFKEAGQRYDRAESIITFGYKPRIETNGTDFYEPQYWWRTYCNINNNYSNDVAYQLELKGQLSSTGTALFTMQFQNPGTLL
jgi:hypothetical protein